MSKELKKVLYTDFVTTESIVEELLQNKEIKKAITPNMHLILNADDPYLQKFALETKCPITYYGIEKSKYSYLKNHYENLVIEYCPVCHKYKKNDPHI